VNLDLSPYLDAVEGELRLMLTPSEERTAPLYQMMRYHMGWADAAFGPVEAPRGKRLRPLLCLLACQAAGGDWACAVPAAAAVELIHNFSLIHDDIEDNSTERRHRATVWALWGVPQGVNTGDTMWILSQLAMQRLLDRGHAAGTVLRVVRTLNEAVLELCSGQYLDLHFETTDSVTVADYERMIRGKTGALLAGAVAAGALLGGASDEDVASYHGFGLELGLAFQMADDILGIWGDPAVTGKSAASDILTKKKTLPVLHALAFEAQRGEDALRQLYAQEHMQEADIPRVLEALERAGAREVTQSRAHEHLGRALVHLGSLHGDQAAHEELRHLALSLAQRSA
jgi:geranylgeranyl diphosphate synthase type I